MHIVEKKYMSHGMDSSPLVRPRHISISVRPIQNFFMSAVDFEVKLNRSFCRWIQGDGLKAACLGRGHWKERNIVC